MVISLGVNDAAAAAAVPNLLRVGAKVHGRREYWLLPAHHDYARAAIRWVAARFGDWIIDCAPVVRHFAFEGGNAEPPLRAVPVRTDCIRRGWATAASAR